MIRKLEEIINNITKYFRVFSGRVVDINDEFQKGRVKCLILELGWDTNDKAIWCYPNDKKSIITPKVGDWVRIQFMLGNINKPFYVGIMNEIDLMLPSNFDGQSTTHIIYESNENDTYIKYDSQKKEFEIKDSNSNIITLKAGNIDIKGTLINLLGASESFIKGDTICNAFTSLCTTIATATFGNMAQNAAGIETIKTAFATFNAQINNFKSITIKGE